MKLEVDDNLEPKVLVKKLNEYIIGQDTAKRAVAIAFRSRYRRRLLAKNLQEEIYPKNIIMIGSTGVGKTEISRRISQLTGAPFLKIEATKYTEVGYVGRDVESIIRDLLNVAINMVKKSMRSMVISDAEKNVEKKILQALYPVDASKETKDTIRQKYKESQLEKSSIQVDIKQKMQLPSFGMGSVDLNDNLSFLGELFGSKSQKKTVLVHQARKILLEQECENLLNKEYIIEEAIQRTQEMGIVFIDEIDKIASSQKDTALVSREGVQRDILPIIEGCKVDTRYGIVDTSHILFIAAGAFHIASPSDLIPELQGRFPLVVKLEELAIDDLKKILTDTKNSLIKQYIALLSTEKISLQFSDDVMYYIAEFAYRMNLSENIGARRLVPVLETILEDISFNADLYHGKEILIDKEYAEKQLSKLWKPEDLSYSIL